MTLRPARSFKEQLEEIEQNKKQRRDDTRRAAKAGNDEISLIAELAASSHLQDSQYLDVEESTPPFQEPTVMSEPVAIPILPAKPTSTPTPAILQIPGSSMPDPINQAPRMVGKRAEDKAPQMKTYATVSGQIPPVPLTEEQRDIYSWMFLVECQEAMQDAKRERRLARWNQWTTLVISILGIVGGSIAIRNGLNAAAERDRR